MYARTEAVFLNQDTMPMIIRDTPFTEEVLSALYKNDQVLCIVRTSTLRGLETFYVTPAACLIIFGKTDRFKTWCEALVRNL